MLSRDWTRYAIALNLYLNAGMTYAEIGKVFGVSKQRAHQILTVAGHRLAYRVFEGVPKNHWVWDEEREAWRNQERRAQHR